MSSSPDIVLIFPPFWDTSSPYLSVPTLASWLHESGIVVETVDLNLRCITNLLSTQSLKASLKEASKILNEWPHDRSEEEKQRFSDNLYLCKKVWQSLGDNLLSPFNLIKSPVQTVDDYTTLHRKLGWAFNIASTPFYPVQLKIDGLVKYDELSKLSNICKFSEASSGAPGLHFIETFAKEMALRKVPLIGISVAGPSQLIPSFLIARIIKTASPETFVCIGGPQIPYIIHSLYSYDKPFDWVDAFIVGEGELPLSNLCRAICNKKDITSIKGLHIRLKGKVIFTGEPDCVDITKLPPPDFTGFEPWLYIGNTGCLPLSFSRGCSWNRCAFCTQHICYNQYRAMRAEQITNHVSTVLEKYKVSTLSINDENLGSNRIHEIAKLSIFQNQKVKWQALTRFEPGFINPQLAQDLVDAGCVMLSMGLESASQDILDLNTKGIRVSKVPEILKTLSSAGIWLNIFLIIGLPGETSETALDTISFIRDNKFSIDSISPTIFRVEKGSPIFQSPKRYGLILGEIPYDHCESEVPVNQTAWLNKSESMVFLELLINSLVGTPQCPIEQADLNGQFVLQMLSEMGINGLREEMKKRAESTKLACELIEQGESNYQKWWTSVFSKSIDEIPQQLILAIPDRGTFFSLLPHEMLILRMRKLGIPIHHIWQGYSTLLINEVERAGMAWNMIAFVLLLLSSRIIQESSTLSIPIETLCLNNNCNDETQSKFNFSI